MVIQLARSKAEFCMAPSCGGAISAEQLMDGTAEGSSPQNLIMEARTASWSMGAPPIVGLRPQSHPHHIYPAPQNGIGVEDAQ